MKKTAIGLAFALCALGAQAQEKAGEVLYVAGGAARVAADGTAWMLKQGDPVFEGDLLRTGTRTYLQVAMRDEGFLGLRPETELRLKRYGEGQVLLEIVKGTLRSITGVFAKPNRSHYRLDGHYVVLGIRGTDHEAFQRDDGFYDRVTEGGTYLEQAKGRVDVPPGLTGFAPRKPDGVPVLLPRTPEFVLAFLPPAAAHAGPRPREHSPLDLKLPAAARFDTPPVGGPAEFPGASVTGTGVGTRPTVVLPEVVRPRPSGRSRN